jgi:hypothetical protein
MAKQSIDLNDDSWIVSFKVGDREYSCDSLVFTSIVMDKVKDDEEPPKEVVVAAMREAIGDTEGLSDHQLFAMSIRMTKAMASAGNA